MDEAPDSRRGFDFGRYIAKRKRDAYGGSEEAARYAYSADLAMLQTFKRMKPVEMAAEAIVRMYKDGFFKNQLLGTTIKVTPRQFPRIYRIAEECAESLDVPVPQVYVANSPVLNAYTFGTQEEAFIVVHSALIDHYDYEELKFVIGHETGHIQNKHVVYNTVLLLLKNTAVAMLRFVLPPVEVALNAWYRRAEITCDRAGLLCTGDLDAGTRALLKLACGSTKLYDELDVEAYLEQFEEGRGGVGRFTELFASHPFLTKRIQALRTFASSSLYHEAIGSGDDGLSMEEVDRRTSEIIQIMKGKNGEDEGGAA